ncbi:MAG: VOC family protein [Rhodospirillales bacterium]
MDIDRIDHFVITARDVTATAAFYERVLGMKVVTFGAGRTALTFGRQKINLHQAGAEPEPRAARPTPGGSDFCLITTTAIPEVVKHLETCGVEIELAPSSRTGATGPITSVYFRDPDDNLVEVSTYD